MLSSIAMIATVALAYQPPNGTHAVVFDTYTMASVLGYGEVVVDVWYPKDLFLRKYPLVSFAHGWMSGDDLVKGNYETLLTTVASYGLIVVATTSCNGTDYCENFYLDQLAAIEAAVPSAHPVFEHVDHSVGYGVFGHSMGGYASVNSASGKKGQNIKAAVALHPVLYDVTNPNRTIVKPVNVSVPIFYTTGSNDFLESFNLNGTQVGYNMTDVPAKAFTKIWNIDHNDMQNHGHGYMNRYTAMFLKCFLGSPLSCLAFFGGLCSSQEYEYQNCMWKYGLFSHQ